MRYNKIFLMAMCIFFVSQEVNADSQTISLKHQDSISHLNVVKGIEVILKNDHQDAVYNISLINVEARKRVVNVIELPAGGSFRLEFGREGTYHLFYSLKPNEGENENRYVQINVIAPHPA